MARYNVDLQDDEGNAYQIMANPDSVAEFSSAPSRENIKSGETHRVIFGKIMKYLSEVGNAAYVGLANNCTTTVEGFALDARQGKELMDRINELNRKFQNLNYKDIGNITASMAIQTAVAYICGNEIPPYSSCRGRFQCLEGWFDYDIIRCVDDYCSGIINGHTVSTVYTFYKNGTGANPVLKKLGSGVVSLSNYVFNFNVSTSGNGSSSGSQGRSGKSEFILDTKDYETLIIGSYKIEGDGAHAAWDPRNCVSLSVVINGAKTVVNEGGHTFDVKNTDSATIVATFGTNGNPDYGTWATLTVSKITMV